MSPFSHTHPISVLDINGAADAQALAIDHARGGCLIPVGWMSLLPIDKAQLDLRAIDEEESEAVALSIIEYIFTAANAHFHQHRLSQDAIQATAALLTANMIDALSGAMLSPEATVDPSRFTHDPNPEPDPNDRHAARCLPHRSIGLSTEEHRVESHSRERTQATAVRKRRKKTEKVSPVRTPLVVIPQVILMPETNEDEREEDRAWRLKCLKELHGEPQSKRKPGMMSKWSSFARQTPTIDPRISMEVEVIDNLTPLVRHEIQSVSGAGSIQMKSSLHTFSSVSTPRLKRSSVAPTAQATSTARRTSTRLSVSQSEPLLSTTTQLTPQRKVSGVQLNDDLSRKRSTASGTASSSPYHAHLHHTHSHDLNAWLFKGQDTPPGGDPSSREPFVPDMMVASAASIPTTISLAAGVEMVHVDGKIKGPERRDSSHTMSRKRFELHQRLATDHLLQEQALMQRYASAHSPTASKSTSPQNRLSPRPYETVPPDPIPVPSLSPIAKNALIIPRTHLSQSTSTPSLRTRNPVVMKRTEGPSTDAYRKGGIGTADETIHMRPGSALGAVTPRKKMPIRQHTDVRPKTSSGALSSPGQSPTYLHTAEANDSARQRLAWIS